MKIALVNPPGKKLSVRSYYCGSTSKSNYLFQPLDLLILSGILYQKHEITVIDCIAEGLSVKETVKKIMGEKAEVAVCVVSILTWESDLEFLRTLKKQMPSLIIIANGDVFFEEPERILKENKCIDAVIFDFISDDIIHYLNKDENNICNMLYRKGDEIVLKKNKNKAMGAVFSIPTPRHELFLNKNYRFPFARQRSFTTTLTNFGCSFQCSFCIANKLDFKYRQAEEVLKELRYILELGIKEIFFEDMSFGLPKKNTIDLCEMILKNDLEFGWTCFSRVDLVDDELLLLMKKAGCHTIMFGVESANEKILSTYHKGYTISQVIKTFKMCRKLGIKTVATFILGLPEETRESCLETIRLSKEIDCDYASFNVAVPRPGTELRSIAIKEGLIKSEAINFDHSGKTVSMPSKYLSGKEIMALKKKAVREFYFRPSYILKQLSKPKSFRELVEHGREFIGLLANNIL